MSVEAFSSGVVGHSNSTVARVGDRDLMPAKRILRILVERSLERLQRLLVERDIFGCNKRLPEFAHQKRLTRTELDGRLIGGDSGGRLAVLKQDLASQLVEIGIVWFLGDDAVHLAERGHQVRNTIGRNRARIARLDTLIAWRIASQHDIGTIEKADELGLHTRIRLFVGVGFLNVGVGARIDPVFQCADAFH